ncbi:hypothetical protein GL263_27175 [Streptomyces durbertensis]|uniref:DUF5671 domain-containing protein n=1 Tax=Streptomyces durbertensis TaxID=2448886 RepID=A0ABR6EPD0_9ACTN|nr:hypothetical protein [Streptomyces durbertensis]MBB1247201.1 hypothetical protein [Streptomyces durbertensis]
MSSSFLGRAREIAAVVAPTTVVTALLFYFGYVALRARFRYYGVDLDLVDLTLQETLLYGVEVLYPPVLVVALIGLLVTGLHAGVRWLLAAPERDVVSGWLGVLLVLVGLLALARGLVGFLVAGVSAGEHFPVTPLALALGSVAVAYGGWVLHTVAARRHDWSGESDLRQAARRSVGWLALVGVASAFWATNEFAAAHGRGKAEEFAEGLPARPHVLLHTREPLRGVPCGVEYQDGGDEAGAYRHRYQGLRLLVESGGRLFVVPAHWRDGRDGGTPSRTLVVPYGDEVRVELRPTPRVPPRTDC